jgi:hypothetical protein
MNESAKCPYRAGLPELPRRMRGLPLDERGYPVPWFVQWLGEDGEPLAPGHGRPEFRVMDGVKRVRAVKERRCWVCGEPLGKLFCFVVGPMCAVSRISAEPPSHTDCAEYSARACPFLTTPHEKRRTDRLPMEYDEVPGMIHRNPGVALVWKTTHYQVQLTGDGRDFIFVMGDPEEVEWYSEGRVATREEVEESVESGVPLLQAAAAKAGSAGVESLVLALARAKKFWPPAAAEEPKADG